MFELGEKVITGVKISEGEQYILFIPNYGECLLFEAIADCCSETWYSDIIGLHNLLNRLISGVEILKMPQPQDDRSRQEYDEAYGFRLKTDKGHCDIIYRNSSNGFYGGWSEQVKDLKRYKEILENNKFVEITENDWQA